MMPAKVSTFLTTLDMDVDMDPPTPSPSSGIKRSLRPPPSSSTGKRPKRVLPQNQLNALNGGMKDLSRRWRWLSRVNDAGDDASEWRDLFSDVLVSITGHLAITDLKASVTPPQNSLQADEIVKGFDDEEFDEWKRGVQKGVKENDWTVLISQRK